MFIKHKLTRIPADIKKETVFITILGVITSIVFDLLSFFLQLGKTQISSGHIILGLSLITVYYVKNTLHDFTSLWMDEINEEYREHYTIAINNKVVEVLLKVRGKVWRFNEITNTKEKMSTNVLLTSSQKYISLVWNFKTGMPKNIFQIISVIIMFVGFIMVTTIEIENTVVFISIIVVVSILSVLFSTRRMYFRQRFRKDRKHVDEKQSMALNDALNIEPMNSMHAKYMADNYITVSKEKFAFQKRDRKSINKVNLMESCINSLATIFIIVMKVYETGLENVNLTVVLSIISLMAIYSQIMNRVESILYMIEGLKEDLANIKNYKDDFSEIVRVLDEEEKEECMKFGKIESVTIPRFAVQYQAVGAEKPFSLHNEKSIELVPGDIVLLTGPTGSGKSTLMKMVTRTIRFENFELFYKKIVNGAINCVMHQTDGRLGCNCVLSEIVFDKDVDEKKLFHILRGLHLYEEISEKNSDVIEHLKTSYARDYSTGQRQRLAIARLLYNLDDTIQIIGFDEATNALNDEITLKTLNFIKTYCVDKILLVATHQVDMGQCIANKRLQFMPVGDHYSVMSD